MTAAIILVSILTIVSIVFTLLFIGKGDQDYSSSAKKNTMNLTLIYAVAILLSLIALAIYIWFF